MHGDIETTQLPEEWRRALQNVRGFDVSETLRERLQYRVKPHVPEVNVRSLAEFVPSAIERFAHYVDCADHSRCHCREETILLFEAFALARATGLFPESIAEESVNGFRKYLSERS